MALLTRRLCYAIAFLYSIVAVFSGATAQNIALYEQEIKVGLLYNFLKYTDWPEGVMPSSSRVVLCMFGENPFGDYVKPMEGRTVNQHTITVKTITSISDISTCHLLFIHESEQKQWPSLQQALAGKSILTVSDINGFASAGGMIEFGRLDNRISVALNMQAVTAAKLQVQDRMLRLVTMVPNTNKQEQR